MVAVDVPEGNVEELSACISPLWDGLGQISVGPFVPSLEKTKIAVCAGKGVAVWVDLKSIIDYIAIHNITIEPCQALLAMIVPGTWQLLVEDCTVAEAVCALHSVLVLGKELMVGPWLDVFGSGAGHSLRAELAATSSCTAIVGFFATKCGMVLNSHFGKLLDSRYAPWMLIEFVSASSLCNALVLSGTKHFNSKVISMVQAKSVEEQEAKVKAHTADQSKHANRSAETQARQLRQAEWKAHNDSAITEYAQLAEAAAVGFSPII